MNHIEADFSLKVQFPELSCFDEISVKTDLTSAPPIRILLFNFYRFLTRIGIPPEEIKKNLHFLQDIPEDLNFMSSSENSKKSSESKKSQEDFHSILKNAHDKEQRESFLNRLNSDEHFLTEVFSIFLESFISEE